MSTAVLSSELFIFGCFLVKTNDNKCKCRQRKVFLLKGQSLLQAEHVGARSDASLVTLCSCNQLGGKTSGLEGQPEKSLVTFLSSETKLRSTCLCLPGGIGITVSRKGQNVYTIHFAGWVTSLRSGQM